jgi:hypothetical protein
MVINCILQEKFLLGRPNEERKMEAKYKVPKATSMDEEVPMQH